MTSITSRRRRRPGRAILAVLGGAAIALATGGLAAVGPAVAAAPRQAPACESAVVWPSGVVLEADGSVRCDDARVVMQGDGNLVLYLDLSHYALGPTAVWQSGTAGHPGAVAAMQTDGNLVVYSGDGRPLWQSGTAGQVGAAATLDRDGTFVVAGRGIWIGYGLDPAGNPYLSTLLPGATLRSWATSSTSLRSSASADGRQFLATMAFPGELYLAVGDKRYWSTGTRAFEDDNTTFVVMQADGNLVIYSQFCSTRPSFVCNPPNVRWQSGTAGHPGAVAVIQNDGNFVVYSAGQPRWQSGTAGVVVK